MKQSPLHASSRGFPAVVAHAIVGWALCGATMTLARSAGTMHQALVIHALATPVIFVAVSIVYFRRFGSWSPLRTAATFLGVVIALDFFVVALFVERSLAMFRSLLGTWLPFLLIFTSTWLTGTLTRRATHRVA